jgi:hypothetical protein
MPCADFGWSTLRLAFFRSRGSRSNLARLLLADLVEQRLHLILELGVERPVDEVALHLGVGLQEHEHRGRVAQADPAIEFPGRLTEPFRDLGVGADAERVTASHLIHYALNGDGHQLATLCYHVLTFVRLNHTISMRDDVVPG